MDYANAAAQGALVGGLTGLRNCAPLIGTGGGYAICVGGYAVGGAVSGAAGQGLWELLKKLF